MAGCVRLLRVLQGRVLRVDTRIDHADHDVLAGQPQAAAQAVVAVIEPEEFGTEIGRERPDLVLPDGKDLGHVLELVGGPGRHLGREAVEAESIAVDQVRARAGLRNDRPLFHVEFPRVVLDGRGFTIEPEGAGGSGFGDERLCQLGVELGRRRARELDDVDLALRRVFAAGELDTDSGPGIAKDRCLVRGCGNTGGQHERHPLARSAEDGRTCP